MKKVLISLFSLCLVVVVGVLFFINKEDKEDQSYLRVHIRANSNSQCDQAVKMQVKSAVVNYLTDKIAKGSTFEEVYKILESNLENIEQTADEVLKENGFSYTCNAKLNNEYFPTRSYQEWTLENGYYDALILELGSGKGDNWWCVVYPPLCFIGAEGGEGREIKYKSKFLEIIQKFFG